MKTITKTLRAPLAAAWTEQYVCLPVEGLEAGAPLALTVNGQPTPFQYTDRPGEVLLRLGFAKDEEKTLAFVPGAASTTDRRRVPIPLAPTASIGRPGRELLVGNPLAQIGPFPVTSTIHCESPLESQTLTRTNDGPLFTDYELVYRFAQHRQYRLQLRCYQAEPIIEVAEEFSLGMNARLEIAFNPQGQFDSILSRDNFEGENQPTVEPLNQERPRDLLCRLQMPVLSEYFVPTNRGWFAFFHSQHEARGMLGLLGLYGARWTNPVANMPKVSVRGGQAVLQASLESGRRHWLLYVGPVEKQFTPQHRLVFHRLHAEFNALRLDEHLDLTASEIYDAHCWDQPGFFGPEYRARAQANAAALPPLRKVLETNWHVTLRALLEPGPATRQAVLDRLLARNAKWVWQFQGYRDGQHDYAKNVIGFSRVLRGLLLDYELLRKDRFLSDAQVRQLQAYFVFAARRILDEGRWPHSRSALHPDHPESTRDVYAYTGEHKPDRLYWTNCLPNFQSDPLCALLHVSAVLPEHPDAAAWRAKGLEDLESQLNAYCGRSGAWEESINYALYTLTYFVITFRALKHRCGIDYFQDSRVRAIAAWLVRFFGPFDKRFDAYTFPGIGNARLPQQYGECLLTFAGELAAEDPLRHDLLAVYQKLEPMMVPDEHRPMVLAMAPIPDRPYPLRPLGSEHMDELGVALRHAHPTPQASYLFQKIGFWKDHYECDETAFNWYAKGTPLCMEYGTYTGDAGGAAAHNLVEIPDMDALRRGYLAEKLFTPAVDYTRSEVPVTLKLLHGHPRTFAEVDGPPVPTTFFYIGEENPVGPKVWKTRLLLFVKPDYVVLLDRVFGSVPHRFNLHVTADRVQRDGPLIQAHGRFDLDLLGYVQHPAEFAFTTGEFVPAPHVLGAGPANPHRQQFLRLTNTTDGTYRTALFAQERGRAVRFESIGTTGLRVITPEYEDVVFLNDQPVSERAPGVKFQGRVGWIRRETSGTIRACLPNGDQLEAFGRGFDGRGPWSYNLDGHNTMTCEGVPRSIRVR